MTEGDIFEPEWSRYRARPAVERLVLHVISRLRCSDWQPQETDLDHFRQCSVDPQLSADVRQACAFLVEALSTETNPGRRPAGR